MDVIQILSRRVRAVRLVLMVWAVLAFTTLAVAAQSDPAPSGRNWSFADLVTLPNLVSAAILIFHFGALRQELRDLRDRLTKLESFRDDSAPDTYERKDVLAPVLKSIDSRLERIERSQGRR
jgi:hypothetical protein